MRTVSVIKLLVTTAFGLLLIPQLEAQDRNVEPAEYSQPELIAVYWSDPMRTRQAGPPAAWRPDGTMLTEVEVADLQRKVDLHDGFVPQDEYLRVLVLMFRIDGRAMSRQRLTPTFLFDSYSIKGGGAPFTDVPYAMAGGAPAKAVIPQWPTSVDVEVRYPVSEIESIRILNHEEAVKWTAESPLLVEKGVNWYFEQPKPIRPSETLYPIGMMAVDFRDADPLKDYDLSIQMQDSLRADLRSESRGDLGAVFLPVAPERKIKEVRISAIRYKTARYNNVATHPELNKP
jgi:hypothetical protein